MQSQVRAQGQQMVSAALGLLSKEKTALTEVLTRSRQLLFYSVGLLLLCMGLNAYLLGSRMLSSIGRFGQYANRIASGDFTPLTPTRRYRDEFTELALAINSMIEELEKREAVLVQSHKMRAVGTLTAGVAHELNNPMNNITLTAHMLQEDYADLGDEERQGDDRRRGGGGLAGQEDYQQPAGLRPGERQPTGAPGPAGAAARNHRPGQPTRLSSRASR